VQTFLIADIAGYAQFTEEWGDEAAAHLTSTFAQVVREGIEPHEGRLVEQVADMALVVFASSKQALRAALELQARFTAAAAQDRLLPLHVRMGLDAGEAVAVAGGFRGVALNRASRLCSLAASGEVLASEAVVHLAHKVEGVACIQHAPAKLRGFADPQSVFQIVPAQSAPDKIIERPDSVAGGPSSEQ
jgi:class 3 adenylate cyclase